MRKTWQKNGFVCLLDNLFGITLIDNTLGNYGAFSDWSYRFVFPSISSVLQNSPPNPLNFYYWVVEHPHVVNVLQLQLQHFQIILLCMFSWLPLLKIFWYKFAFTLWYEKRVPLLNINYPVVYNFQIRKTIDDKMSSFWVLLQRIVLVAENLQAFHSKNGLNRFKSEQFVGL